jgi:hypothetical protein
MLKKNNYNNSNAKPGKRSEHGDEVLENVKNRGPGKYKKQKFKNAKQGERYLKTT